MTSEKDLYRFLQSVGNLGEIVLVLRALKRGPLEKWVLQASVYGHSGATARIPDPFTLIRLSEFLGLTTRKIDKRREVISISGLGTQLLRFEAPQRDRLAYEQGKLLFRQIVRNAQIAGDVTATVDLFSTDGKGGLWISCRDKRIGVLEDRMLRLLQQLRVASYDAGHLAISRRDREWMEDSLFVGVGIDIESLLRALEKRRTRGDLAEEYVLDKEKERLGQCGRQDLANLVRRISKRNTGAGYDILSFDGFESGSIPDRFIEVKSTSGDVLTFYMSKRELETARSLQDSYWVYCVLNADSEKRRKLVRITNPHKEIFETHQLKAEAVLWSISHSQDSISSGGR